VPPLVLALFVAQTLGNVVNHGLYHGLIDVQGLPYLTAEFDYRSQKKKNPEWDGNKDDPDWEEKEKLALTLEDVMIKQIPTFNVNQTVSEVWDKLCELFDHDQDKRLDPTEFGGEGGLRSYPVVEDNKRFVGMITIDDLRAKDDSYALNSDRAQTPIREFMKINSVAARGHWKLSYGYCVFERLGLRQMVVLSDEGVPVGMITRLTLMPWWFGLNHPHEADHGHSLCGSSHKEHDPDHGDGGDGIPLDHHPSANNSATSPKVEADITANPLHGEDQVQTV